MKTFTIKIAGYTFEVNTEHDFSYQMCVPFLVQEKAQYHVRVFEQDISNEMQWAKTGGLLRYRSEDEYEFIALLRIIADILIDQDIFLIHGAAIYLDQKAFLFSGKSGAGKTTHIFKWLQHRPDLCIINGDKPFIRVDNVPMVCSSPWSGKECIVNNMITPLSSVIFLERSNINNIKKISNVDALPFMLQQVYFPADEFTTRNVLHLVQQFMSKMTFWHFQCNNLTDDCFHIAHNALLNNKS